MDFIERFIEAYRELQKPYENVPVKIIDVVRQMKSKRDYIKKMLSKIRLYDFEERGYMVSFGKPMGSRQDIFLLRGEYYLTVFIKKT